ncbi:MerR family transcriptional regulator [Phytoactinopolyspora alkaliphila]|uniref:MerR family transcriptional regulator n=1 Tax=Phytoactinopolyspora alkaliphila TaxID=1783498 RepID=A0A6N9YLG4_9ACTN|nr:MerR family transcriptional regulator [Phytoactinopolyspora alkaliphila]NED95866.1 MerR family transcriptional regulator [Phytoactinopolyspora alkaliphila]
MKIGELAERTGVAPRLIRYYEQQGLVTTDREDNGYRAYTEAHVERVTRVASLVRAGIPTRLVRVLLDTEDAATRGEPTCPRNVAEQLAAELVPIEDRIACLTRSRDAIRSYLKRSHHEVLLQQQRVPSTASAG